MTVINFKPVRFSVVATTCVRILRQLRHDPHTIVMAVAIPSALIVLVRYVLNSEPEFDASAAHLLAIFPFSVMFLVTSIATVRERVSGTLERLLTCSVARIELLLGYVAAFGLVAAVQVLLAVVIGTTWLGMEIDGSPATLVFLLMLNAILGIAFGLLGSAITRTEYQVVQLLPIFVLPQVLVCGLFTTRESMASALDAIAGVLPLPLVVDAASDVAHTADAGMGTMINDVLAISAYVVVTLVIGAATLGRSPVDWRKMRSKLGKVLEPVRTRVLGRFRRPVADEGIEGRFELYQDKAGKFRFRLKNGEGAVIAASGAFSTQSEAEDAIKALCRAAPRANVDKQVTDVMA